QQHPVGTEQEYLVDMPPGQHDGGGARSYQDQHRDLQHLHEHDGHRVRGADGHGHCSFSSAGALPPRCGRQSPFSLTRMARIVAWEMNGPAMIMKNRARKVSPVFSYTPCCTITASATSAGATRPAGLTK